MEEPIRTARLDLVPVTPAMIEALLRGEAARLERLAVARFPRPLAPPPLFGEHAPVFRYQMRVVSGRGLAWRFWFLVEREAGGVVGVVGLPGAVVAGAVRIGYSIYPAAQERGFATEAVRGLVDWLLAQPGVTQVLATVAPENTASLGVARKAGMRAVGTSRDEDGELIVLARGAPRGIPGAAGWRPCSLGPMRAAGGEQAMSGGGAGPLGYEIPSVSGQEFRDALARWPSGVTVVTARENGTPYGMTAASFSSLSLDPPLVLVCVDKTANAHDGLTNADGFVVHVLGREHEHLSVLFAQPGAAKFRGFPDDRGLHGSPLLPFGPARLSCVHDAALEGGDHTILVGRVVGVELGPEGSEPLIYSERTYHGLDTGEGGPTST